MTGEFYRPDANGAGFGHEPHLFGELQRERSAGPLLTPERVAIYMNDVVAQTAARAWITRKHGPKKWPNLESEADFKIRLDEEPTGVMESFFDQSQFGINIVGCEGDKERREYGEEATVHTIRGFHGGLNKSLGSVDSAVDPVEGTKDLLKDQIGAIVIAANSLFGNIPLSPPEFVDFRQTIKTDASYMNRIVLGKEFAGVDPEMSLEEILEIGRRNTGISDRKKFEIVILKRERNRVLIEQAQASGATVTLREGGDLVPALAALWGNNMSSLSEDRRVIISMGSGGKEEAMIAAMAARAVGGFFWGRYEDDIGNPSKGYSGLKRLEKWLPGEPKDFIVSLAGITGVDSRWFNLPQVKLHLNGDWELRVAGLDITSNGFIPTLRIYNPKRKSYLQF